MYVVTGATGNTGSVVANRLLSADKQVRVIARSADRLRQFTERGAEAAPCDLTDTAALTKAFAGAEAVYLLIPPDLRAQDVRAYQERISDSLTRAVADSRVTHAVVLSSIGAEKPSGTGPVVGLHNLEEKLKGIGGLNVLFLRAGYFMENTLAQNNIIKFLNATAGPLNPDLMLPLVATRDIGDVAADELLNRSFQGISTREVLGPRDLCMDDMNAALALATGRPDLHYMQLPAAQLRGAMTQMGMSANFVDLLLEMSDALNSGQMKPQQPRSERSTTPTTYQTFVAEDFLPLYQGKTQAA